MIQALSRLLPYVVAVRRPLILGLACILAATAFSLVSPWVLKLVVDGLVEEIDRTRLGIFGLITVALAVGDGWFRYRMRILVIGASREVEYALRRDFFAHLERLPPAYFQENRVGDLMSRATNDLSAVRMMTGPALMYFVSTSLGFVLAVTVMFSIDASLTLMALMPLPGVTLGTRYFGRAIHDRFERIQAQLSEMSVVAQEAISGVRVVRAYGQEEIEVARFARANDEYRDRNQRLIRLQAFFYPTLTLCFGLSGLLVLWRGGRSVMSGELTLGDLVAFMRYLVLLSWPLIAFGWVINLAQRGLASWERMLEVLDTPQAAGFSLPARVGPLPAAGRIEARHLTFRYPGAHRAALTDVSFTVEPGETVALVGPTGAGKSTLVQLLSRLREPERGTLFVDGLDVCDRPLADLRAAMTVVTQEPFLFSDTVAENIRFGREAPAEPEVPVGQPVPVHAGAADLRAAAALASIDTEVMALPRGYETLVGERGITLSGGQKQRVALARSVLADARILVLDDSLSAVDTSTEDAILRGLRQIRRSRTVVLVAHRISTVRDADLILVFDDGRIVERGTHEALVRQGGLYADMDRRQQLEAELSRESMS